MLAVGTWAKLKTQCAAQKKQNKTNMVSYLMVLKTVQMSSPLQFPAHENFMCGHSPLRTQPDSVVNPWRERKMHMVVKTLQ